MRRLRMTDGAVTSRYSPSYGPGNKLVDPRTFVGNGSSDQTDQSIVYARADHLNHRGERGKPIYDPVFESHLPSAKCECRAWHSLINRRGSFPNRRRPPTEGAVMAERGLNIAATGTTIFGSGKISDEGGEGIGYHDLDTSNVGGENTARRAVDIEQDSDGTNSLRTSAGPHGGEWLQIHGETSQAPRATTLDSA